MITKTLANTKRATYQVLVPSWIPQDRSFPKPYGTGFFITSDGFFITANHVLQDPEQTTFDIKNIKLMNPTDRAFPVQGLELVKQWPEFDIALLHVDISKNKDFFGKRKKEFNFIAPEFNIIPEGTEVYSFGYPLSEAQLHSLSKGRMMGIHTFYPRITSMIISSHNRELGPLFGQKGHPRYYVVDKACNYGNSGGPIIDIDSGRVFSVVIAFQPVAIPQEKKDEIIVLSLYGYASSLKNIEAEISTLH